MGAGVSQPDAVGPPATQQKWPVEALSVEGNQKSNIPSPLGKCGKDADFLRIVSSEILPEAEALFIALHSPNQKDRARAQTSGLEVQENDIAGRYALGFT